MSHPVTIPAATGMGRHGASAGHEHADEPEAHHRVERERRPVQRDHREAGPHERLVPAEQHLAATTAEQPRAERETERDRDREQREGDEAGRARDEPGHRHSGCGGGDHPAGTGEVRVVACDVEVPPCTTTRWRLAVLALDDDRAGIVRRRRRRLRTRPGEHGEHGEERPGRKERCPEIAHLSLLARRAAAAAGAAGVIVWPICGTDGAAGTPRFRPAIAAAPVNAVAARTAASMNTSRRFTVFGPG